MKKLINSASIIAVLTLLTACGHTTGDRALSGAAIGAGIGAATSAVTGGNAGTGAVIGGVVGGAAGALTKDKDIDLGKPVWR